MIKRSLIPLAMLCSLSVSAQVIRQGGSATLPNEVTCGLNGTSQGCYGFNGRNEAAGVGVNLRNGFGNYGAAAVAVPPLASNTPFGTGLIAVGANAVHSTAAIFRATNPRVDGFNNAASFWSYNISSGSTTTGVYIALSDLPTTEAEYNAQIQPGGLVIDTKASGVPAIVARHAGVPTFTLPAEGGSQLMAPAASQPTCDAAHRFHTWPIAGGAGVADRYEVCGKDAADVYAWKPAATF